MWTSRVSSTLAHELSHYLLATVHAPIPGGNDLNELATEFTVAYCGFGVFGANAAFTFEQHQDNFGQGWSSSRSGYFSERTWAFTIASSARSRAWIRPSTISRTAPAT